MEPKRLPPVEAKKLVDEQNYILLDVRSIPEFEEGHPQGAYNIPFLHRTPEGMVPNPDFMSVVKALITDTSKGIVTQCGTGGRSVRAAQQLIQAGFGQVVDVIGGFKGVTNDAGEIEHKGWEMEGLAAETGSAGDRSYAQVAQSVALTFKVSPSAEPEVANPPNKPSDLSAGLSTGEGVNRFSSDTHKVQCVKYKKELPGLKRRPYPGDLGRRLYEEVSALAWNEWVEHSKMIINEYHIVSTDPAAMKMLYEQCEQFFYGAGVDRPAEFVPVQE